MGLYAMIGYQSERTLSTGMLTNPIATTFRYRRDIHRDTDALTCPLIDIRKQEASQIERFLYSYTTMRQSTTIALESTSIICIVKINREIVGEAEYYTTKRVANSTLLTDAKIA